MAECIDSLSDSLASLSAGSDDLDIDERLKELGLDDSARAKLLQIEYEYESIFSWKIKKLTGTTENLMLNRIDKAREECELIVDQGNVFNLNRYIVCTRISNNTFVLIEAQKQFISHMPKVGKNSLRPD